MHFTRWSIIPSKNRAHFHVETFRIYLKIYFPWFWYTSMRVFKFHRVDLNVKTSNFMDHFFPGEIAKTWFLAKTISKPAKGSAHSIMYSNDVQPEKGCDLSSVHLSFFLLFQVTAKSEWKWIQLDLCAFICILHCICKKTI